MLVCSQITGKQLSCFLFVGWPFVRVSGDPCSLTNGQNRLHFRISSSGIHGVIEFVSEYAYFQK